jgi:hypothetical protein
MTDMDAETLCAVADSSASSVRDCLPFRADSMEILDHVWGLQDTLARLVCRASDAPEDVFEVLRRAYPHLLADVADALEVAMQRRLTSIAAVNMSCAAIKNSLLKLECLKQTRLIVASQ